MEKIAVGITGQGGFIGSHLFRMVRLSDDMEGIEFSRDFFSSAKNMRNFTDRCDVIVHLAGLSRCEDGNFLYRTNMSLTEKLLAFARPGQTLMLGSTVHEAKDSPYHASKRDSRAKIEAWASAGNGFSRTLLLPNTFGPGSRPYYNSVVSTFCALAAQGKIPEKIDDVSLNLIDVESLCTTILESIRKPCVERRSCVQIPYAFEVRLPDLWRILLAWRALPEECFPAFSSNFEKTLFYTFSFYRNLYR